jgi:hypothetical protein
VPWYSDSTITPGRIKKRRKEGMKGGIKEIETVREKH